MEEDLIKKADIEKIAKEGEKIYEEVKSQYEPQENGKFLAIDIGSKNVFLASSTVEAVQAAKSKYPDNIFYVVKIGFGVTETLARYSNP